uniref:Uncharacterized protein n=1 Tax=Glossina palpalis gambiensis TaxID=67801 RepID=A0A1B0ATJ5_9MUSC
MASDQLTFRYCTHEDQVICGRVMPFIAEVEEDNVLTSIMCKKGAAGFAIYRRVSPANLIGLNCFLNEHPEEIAGIHLPRNANADENEKGGQRILPNNAASLRKCDNICIGLHC